LKRPDITDVNTLLSAPKKTKDLGKSLNNLKTSSITRFRTKQDLR
jgi:hypothetical protein